MSNKRTGGTARLAQNLRKTPKYVPLVLWTVFTIFIFLWIIGASLSSTRDIFSGNLFSSGLQLGGYKKALIDNKLGITLLNSVLYTFPSCALIILVCAPAAYCMSRFIFRFNKTIQNLIVLGLGIPNIMIVMPLFSIISGLNLSNSRWVIVVLYTAVSVPYTTYFLMSFFRGISHTYEEAAAIDGCGQIQCFWRIMFPLARPAIMTVTIFNVISKWNEYFIALMFANKPDMRPVGVGLYFTIQSMEMTGDWSGMFAAVVITFLPTLAIYAFLSKRIVAGVTAGGVKG